MIQVLRKIFSGARIFPALACTVFSGPAAHGQADGAPRWPFTLLSPSSPGDVLSSPAVGADGTVHIGVEVGSATSANPSGTMFAIRPDGSLKWTFNTPDWIDSTAAIAADGTVYFGCWDGKLYALNPNDGRAKWSLEVGSYVSASPAIGTDGTIYIGTGDGNLSAVNPDGTLKWTFPTAEWIDSSPSIGGDGTIYFGSWDNHIYAVRPDGTEKWSYETGGDVVASPAVAADGTVYVGSRDLTLYAFTAAGILKWSINLGDTLVASPVIGSDGTIHVPTTGGRLYAFNPDGTERWRYPRAGQAALNALYGTPALRGDGTILLGTSNNLLLALKADGTLLWQAALGDWADSSPVVAADGGIYIGCTDKKLYSFWGNGQPLDPAAPWPALGRGAARTGRAVAMKVNSGPISQGVGAGAAVTLHATASAESGPAPSYQWRHNGTAVAGATGASLSITNFQPENAGLYTARMSSTAAGATTEAAVLGALTGDKVIGSGAEVGANIVHPNKNIFDQILLEGAAATITADPDQITRLSYIDLTNDIVQVEFSGAGTLSLTLDSATGPAVPVNYSQNVAYMKGHAGIIITGADERTHVSIFTVGRATAYDPTFDPENPAAGGYNILQPPSATNDPANNRSPLFVDRAMTVYDGIANIAYIAISSPNGRFGGVRTANANYFATRGLTGVYAPGVAFDGPVYIGNITAFETAVPVIRLGSANDARITGGSLLQDNNEPVRVSGIKELKFVAGSTSGGVIVSAQANQAQFEEDGMSVTSQIVVNAASQP